MATKSPNQVARFNTSGSKNIAVGTVQQESIMKSGAEIGDSGRAFVQGAGTAVKMVREKHDRDLRKSTQSGLAPEKTAIQLAGYASHMNIDLDNVKDNELDAALALKLGAEADDPRIQEARVFFRKLGTAQATGKPLAQHARFLAQTEVTRLVKENPLFEDEIRAAAKEGLGFDPTGSDMKEAFNLMSARESAQASKKPTSFETSVKNYMSMNLSKDVSEGLAFQDEMFAVEEQNFQRKKWAGTATDGEYRTQGMKVSSDLAADGLFMLEEFKAGGPQSSGNLEAAFSKMALGRRSILTAKLAGAGEATIKHVLSEFDKSTELVKSTLQDDSFTTLLTKDNALISATVKNNVSQMTSFMTMKEQFGNRTLDYITMAADAKGNENLERIMTAISPEFRGMQALTTVDAMNQTLSELAGGVRPANETGAQKHELLTAQALVGTNVEDKGLVEALVQGNTTLGSHRTLRLLDHPTAVRNVVNNPAYANKVQNLYIAERNAAQQQAITAMTDLDSQPGKGLKGYKIVVNDDGRIEINKPFPLFTGMSSVDTQTQQLKESIRRLNNINNLTGRYQGLLIDFDHAYTATLVDETNNYFDTGEESSSSDKPN
jgi:hypothetical protein